MIRHAGLPLAIAVCVMVAGCSRPPAEEQIREVLQEMSAALAASDARAFLEPIAEDFAGDTWQLDRRGARLLLLREMRAHERVRARLVDIQVELVTADRARASFQAVLTGGSGLIPDDGGWYQVRTGWRLHQSEWQLISASWERMIGR